jgi:hypothetical protein
VTAEETPSLDRHRERDFVAEAANHLNLPQSVSCVCRYEVAQAAMRWVASRRSDQAEATPAETQETASRPLGTNPRAPCTEISPQARLLSALRPARAWQSLACSAVRVCIQRVNCCATGFAPLLGPGRRCISAHERRKRPTARGLVPYGSCEGSEPGGALRQTSFKTFLGSPVREGHRHALQFFADRIHYFSTATRATKIGHSLRARKIAKNFRFDPVRQPASAYARLDRSDAERGFAHDRAKLRGHAVAKHADPPLEAGGGGLSMSAAGEQERAEGEQQGRFCSATTRLLHPWLLHDRASARRCGLTSREPGSRDQQSAQARRPLAGWG